MNNSEYINMIDKSNIPNHVGIIVDGNGRYAKELGNERTFGHLKGVLNIKKLIPFIADMGVKELSLYCFSTENFKRPTKEVEYLMKLFIDNFKDYKYSDKKKYQYRIIGERINLDNKVLEVIDKVNNEYRIDDKMVVNICFNYGSHAEICDSVKNIVSDCLNNKISINDISDELVNSYLKITTPVDLLIRTGGELRLSNYLLYQLSYSELYFTKVWFPNFDCMEFTKAILDYQMRNRRFGGLKG